jgi:hypothetical protein
MVLESLYFLATVLVLLSATLALIATCLRRKWRLACSILLVLLIWLGVYLVMLLSVSLLTPQTVLAQRQERCFDEMCFSVTQVTARKTLSAGAQGQAAGSISYLVTVQLRNASRRTAQKPDSPAFTLVDQQGNSYTPAPEAQQVLGQKPVWQNRLQPGETEPRQILFDVPGLLQQPGLIISEGGWLTSFIIGDENSLFHKKTEVRLIPE